MSDARARERCLSLRADLLPSGLRSAPVGARVVFVARRGTSSDQLAGWDRRQPSPYRAGRLQNTATKPRDAAIVDASRDLEFFNGLGGFAAGRRGSMSSSSMRGDSTPAPWVNVIANTQFGLSVSADGGG